MRGFDLGGTGEALEVEEDFDLLLPAMASGGVEEGLGGREG